MLVIIFIFLYPPLSFLFLERLGFFFFFSFSLVYPVQSLFV